ncbi:MAG: S9 family peptidase [Acidobacteria bacterium]|nr:S9 family peptidase [Acidobacteriota bacterium]
MLTRRLVLTLLLAALTVSAADLAYQKPPQALLDVLNAPLPPDYSVSPSGTHLLVLRAFRYPPIADLAQPVLRLAGHRINPANNGEHMPPRSFVGIALMKTTGGPETKLALPAGARLSTPRWSPDGRQVAFTNSTATAVELWLADTVTAKARKIAGLALNAAHGEPVQWMPDSRTLLVQLIPTGRGKPPAAPLAPKGPKIQESAGQAGPVRTLQDMLSSPYDEDLFDYYATAQLALVDAATGKATPVGKPAVFLSTEPAPDGQHILVERIHRPYSYLHASSSFPREIEVWDTAGKIVHKLASLPLSDRVPIEGVSTGPRRVEWRPDQPATLVWIEALDGGDPRRKVPHRDQIMSIASLFQGRPREMLKLEQRSMGIEWSERGDFALVRDYERSRRWSRTFLLNLRSPGEAPRQLWSRSSQDRYNAPGLPVQKTLPNGRRAIRQQGDAIFLYNSQGSTPQGDRPFLDRYDLKTGKSERLFRSAADAYETLEAILDDAGTRLLTVKQSPTEPPNLYLRAGDAQALTHFQDPAPRLRTIRKQLVTYKRADGVNLSFTLYLPPDYKEGTRLPTLVWAYPYEFNDADTAGQVSGSTQRFTVISGMSHLFFALAGYAVLDNAAMPVVGDSETVNNTYVEQIVMNAQAAIDKAAAMGVTDPKRVGVGGHSYGSFMTANLLAHCNLFRAGIARSGAHNRTLTPFGFQSERRTLWEAPDTYLKMSPFMHADKIKAPLLLTHGEADNNPGTFPIQSERMYQAVRGNGGTVRLVILPHESHGYAARESVEHTLWEMINWFDRFVKP